MYKGRAGVWMKIQRKFIRTYYIRFWNQIEQFQSVRWTRLIWLSKFIMLILDDRAIQQQSTAEQGYIVLQHILGSELYGPLCVMTSANKAPTNDDDAWFPLTSPEIYIKNHEQSVFHVQKTPTPFSFSHCLSTTHCYFTRLNLKKMGPF